MIQGCHCHLINADRLRRTSPERSYSYSPLQSRCFSDAAYEKEHIPLVENLDHCDVLLGVKEVDPRYLMPDKTYFIFSHTIKKQNHNRLLLKTILEKHVRLIDYEMLTDSQGIRMIGFGRWAGLVGAYHGIRAICRKLGTSRYPCRRINRPGSYDEDCLGLSAARPSNCTDRRWPGSRRCGRDDEFLWHSESFCRGLFGYHFCKLQYMFSLILKNIIRDNREVNLS